MNTIKSEIKDAPQKVVFPKENRHNSALSFGITTFWGASFISDFTVFLSNFIQITKIGKVRSHLTCTMTVSSFFFFPTFFCETTLDRKRDSSSLNLTGYCSLITSSLLFRFVGPFLESPLINEVIRKSRLKVLYSENFCSREIKVVSSFLYTCKAANMHTCTIKHGITVPRKGLK